MSSGQWETCWPRLVRDLHVQYLQAAATAAIPEFGADVSMLISMSKVRKALAPMGDDHEHHKTSLSMTSWAATVFVDSQSAALASASHRK